MGAQASRTALRIFCKSSLEYLGTLVLVTGVSATGGFVHEGLAGWSDNLSPNSEGEEALGGAMKEATEGRSRQGRPRPWIEVILELIFSKTLFQTGWLTH